MKDKRMSLELENDISLEIRVFYDEDEVKYKFHYRYTKKDDDKVVFVNDVYMWVTYLNCIVQKFHVMMDMTNVELRGKKFIYGVDVSPNSKLILELEYDTPMLPKHELITMSPMEPMRIKAEKEDPFSVWGGFKLTTVRCNNRMMVSDPLKNNELVQQIELPFEVKDQILNDPFGGYRVPIPHKEDNITFNFQNSIKL